MAKVAVLFSGILSLGLLILSYLALTDIWHGVEPDLSAEWRMVSVSLPFVFIYVIASLYFLSKKTGIG